ncbi:phototropic-responsive NPH3 family protein [Striga asiatica]|uniref:Phototropic-responsive NPH3 family protein n=1 Tax=Striga asiatica TaxID=4170 RepID=A0A5A7P7D1_STRAF|nr:phototropic-responsive NPH3 family protein [Striga asiatica]
MAEFSSLNLLIISPFSSAQNLPPSDDDLYGADLHLVRSRAFLDLNIERKNLPRGFLGNAQEIFPHDSQWRRRRRRRSTAGAAPVFLRRTRTWPMQVTFGEDGSWAASMAPPGGRRLLRRWKMGLERDLPRLRLPGLVRRILINGGGNFSARPGLDSGFDRALIFFGWLRRIGRWRSAAAT